MELAMIGLGKMGLNMATRLVRGGHRVVGYARTPATVAEAETFGIEGAHSLEEAVGKLKQSPRVVWVMVPSGATTTDTIEKVAAMLGKGDIIVDGGNSNYKDTLKHAEMLEAKGIDFVDSGTSGGVWGITEGYSLMIGGKPEVTEKLRPIFETLAPGADKGWGRVGPHGAGHYVKMVHNGIEYGMMQALAEGFSVMKQAPFDLDLAKIADLYDHRSVIESRLVGWLKNAFVRYGDGLEGISGSAAQSGEGLWTVEAAKELGVPVPVIEAALKFRTASQKDPRYPGRIISALRNQFGGHEAGEQKR